MSLKEVIKQFYSHDNELLKQTLIAKIEEDKKENAKIALRIEEAKIRLKKLEIELSKERSTLDHNYREYAVFHNCIQSIPPISYIRQHPSIVNFDMKPDENLNLVPSQRKMHQITAPVSPVSERSPSITGKRHYSLSSCDEMIDINKSAFHMKVMKALREKINRKNSQDNINKRRYTLPKILSNNPEHDKLSNNMYSSSNTIKPALPSIDTITPLSPIYTPKSVSPCNYNINA